MNARICFATVGLASLMASAAPVPVTVQPAYLKQGHPRLLFSAADRPALQEKTGTVSNLWKLTVWQAANLERARPTPEQIRNGSGYTQSEMLLSGALIYWLTGEEKYRNAVAERLKAYAAEPVWGSGWRENIDIPCNWYMYYMALAYDILYDSLSREDRQIIRDSLTAHAATVYDAWLKEYQTSSYDQNHTYVPMIALGAAALALYDDVPQAGEWLTLANDILEKSRAVLMPDGYYYESTAYWDYAFHWHLRWADLMQRATGRDYYDLPIFRKNYLQALHMSLPGAPWFFDVGDDSGGGAPEREKRKTVNIGRKYVIERLASVFSDPNAQGAFNQAVAKLDFHSDDPAMRILWHDPMMTGTPADELPAFHCFEDMGIAVWRSGWSDDATVCMFKAGPPLGYSALKTMQKIPGWIPNTGHVHPDIGAIWLYSKGAYLLTDTGYTAKKRTRDHNTFLVDGRGIGSDFTYWVYRTGKTERDNYDKWTQVKLEKVHLEKEYGYVLGDLSAAYPDDLGPITLKRHAVMSRDFILLLDEAGGNRPHTFTSLLHTDREIRMISPASAETVMNGTRLRMVVLAPENPELRAEPAIVFGGRGPTGGEDVQRGFQLSIQTAEPVDNANYVTLLIPQKETETPPEKFSLVQLNDQTLTVQISWAENRTETITLNRTWQPGDTTGPVSIRAE